MCVESVNHKTTISVIFYQYMDHVWKLKGPFQHNFKIGIAYINIKTVAIQGAKLSTSQTYFSQNYKTK